ncbi:MAG: CARDB domain-containing protein [Candidatus Latescibacterota bacterium]
MKTPHFFHIPFPMLCSLFAGLLPICVADAARAGLPDLGFDFLEKGRASEVRYMTAEGAYATENYERGLATLVAGSYDTIRVALQNRGTGDAEQAVVRFYEEGTPGEELTPIGADVTVARITPGETVILQKVWDTLGRAGLNRISIRIDPDAQVQESNEGNNNLSFDCMVDLLGDFNRDGRIDPYDRAILEQAEESIAGDPGWNPACDIWSTDVPIPDLSQIRPRPDGIAADHSDHVVFDRLMDLNLQSTLAEITFDHSDHVVFRVGDPISIAVNFPTVGWSEVGQFSVQFYDGSPEAGGTLIGTSLVSSAYGGIGQADILWHTDGIDVGSHQIFAVADPDNNKVESLEDNNVLSAILELDSTGVTDPDPPLPKRFLLMQNIPNPFNAGTIIPFEIVQPDDSNIRLVIYDNLGREVFAQQVLASHQGRGYAVWDGRDPDGRTVSSGIYFYRLMINNRFVGPARSMVILR